MEGRFNMGNRFKNIEEVIENECFMAWYHKLGNENSFAWEALISSDGELKSMSEDAVVFLNNILIREKDVASEQINSSFQQAMKRINDEKKVPIRVLGLKNKKWMAVAAMLICVFGSVVFFKYFQKGKEAAKSYSTTYGHLQKFLLPDGSEVTLNANTTINLGKEWNDKAEREVWVKGEAFFKVKKNTTHNKFIVHTENLKIIVTGTQFNVINRNNKNSVLLTEGSVTIKTKDGHTKKMIPGDYVEFDQQGLQYKPMQADKVIAWTERKIDFDNTPMESAAKQIEEIYGVQIKLADDKVKGIVLTGMIPNDNLDVLLEAISITQNCTINKVGDSITITSK